VPPPPPEQRYQVVYVSRAAFGVGFIVLGALALARVVMANAPVQSKAVGSVLGLAMIGLGAARLVQYVLWRRGRR